MKDGKRQQSSKILFYKGDKMKSGVSAGWNGKFLIWALWLTRAMPEPVLTDLRLWEKLNLDLRLYCISFIIYLYIGRGCVMGSVVASDLSLIELQDFQWSMTAIYASIMVEVERWIFLILAVGFSFIIFFFFL